MKITTTNHLAAMAFLAFAAPSLHAATVDGIDGVNMGDNGEIGSAPTLTYPSSGFGSWLPLGANANQGLSKFVAPIGQFTGYKDDGSAVANADLIPLRTTSVEILNPSTGLFESSLSNANNGLTKTGGTVQLGGALIQPTTIAQGANPLLFTQAGAGIGINNSSPQANLSVGGVLDVSGGAYTGEYYNATATRPGVAISDQGYIVAKTDMTGAASLTLNRPMPPGVSSAFLQFRSTDGNAYGSIVGENPYGVRYYGFSFHGTEFYGDYFHGGQFLTTSDERLKENVRNTGYGLDTVMKMQVREYNYKKDKAKNQVGFIAQQLHAVLPEAVNVGGEDPAKNPWTVDFAKITPVLAKAIQEQQQEIAALKAENAELKKLSAKVEKTAALVAALEGKSKDGVTVSLTK